MFRRIDIFGSDIKLRFGRKQFFQTDFGSIVTILISGFITFRLIFIVHDVFLRLNPQVIYNERQVDDPAPFNATSYSFPFAFGMEDPTFQNYYIDESIYTINATLRQKFLVYNETTQTKQSVWKTTILKLQKCTLDNFKNPNNQHYYEQTNYTNMYCLPPDFNFVIQGDFPSLVYSYLQLNIQQCSTNCSSSDQINKFLNKATFGMQLSDSYVDPSVKDNPFKIYSRDMFWGASLQLPRDVYIYLRNNYVYSDYGWFFSDEHSQHFPSYSSQEVMDYPANSQKFIMRIMIRFEKQKEGVYKRTYKNFNSIISEIGGFTQSLLAIGYLLCKRFSNLKLNLELINQSFNYDDESVVTNQIEKLDSSIQQQNRSPEQKNQLTNNNQEKNERFTNEDKQKILRKRNFLNDGNRTTIHKEQDNYRLSFSPIRMSNYLTGSQQIQSANPFEQKTKNNRFQQNYLSKIHRDKSKTNNSNLNNQPEEQSYFSEDSKFNITKSPNNKSKKNETEFKQMIEKKTKKMNVSTWDYFKTLIFPSQFNRKKKEVIKYSVDKLYHNLDIFNILKKLVDIEKLKRLLLDQDQLRLFDCLPKPTIQPDLVLKMKSSQVWDQKNKEVDYMYQDERSEMQKITDAFQSYLNITKKSTQGCLDKKLINLLDRNLLSIFEKEAEEKQTIQLSRQNSELSKCNVYEQFLYQNNDKQNQKQEFKIKSDSVIDGNSCNQSVTSSIQDEFMKVEFQSKLNSPIDVKNKSFNLVSLKDDTQSITTNAQIKLDKQNKPNQFSCNANQLEKI